RYWGRIEDHPFLHFEAGYYQAVEFAIANGLRRAEAGARGPHKIARGYLPVTTYSARHVADPPPRPAGADYLEHERDYAAYQSRPLAEHAPYRRTGGAGT